MNNMLLRVTAVQKLPPLTKKPSSFSVFLFADASYQQQATTTDTLEFTFAALAPSQQTWIFCQVLAPQSQADLQQCTALTYGDSGHLHTRKDGF